MRERLGRESEKEGLGGREESYGVAVFMCID